MDTLMRVVAVAVFTTVALATVTNAQSPGVGDRAVKITGMLHPMDGGAFWAGYEQAIGTDKLVTIMVGGYDYYAPDYNIDEWGGGTWVGAIVKTFKDESRTGGYWGWAGAVVFGWSDWRRYSGGMLAEKVYKEFVGPGALVLGGYRYVVPNSTITIEPVAMIGVAASDDIVPLMGGGVSLGFTF